MDMTILTITIILAAVLLPAAILEFHIKMEHGDNAETLGEVLTGVGPLSEKLFIVTAFVIGAPIALFTILKNKETFL